MRRLDPRIFLRGTRSPGSKQANARIRGRGKRMPAFAGGGRRMPISRAGPGNDGLGYFPMMVGRPAAFHAWMPPARWVVWVSPAA